MLYRALADLDAGKRVIRKGCVFLGKELGESVCDALLQRGRIAVVSTPPLIVLPNWTIRAELLRTVGIVTVEQFLEFDTDELAKAIERTLEKVNEWKKEVKAQFVIDNRRRSG